MLQHSGGIIRYPTTGRRTVGRRATSSAVPALAEIARPWLLYEVDELFNVRGRTAGTGEDLHEQILVDLTIREPLRRTVGATEPVNPEELACHMVRLTRFYKQHLMIFRRVGCEMVPPFAGTRPSPEQRVPVLQRIAAVLNNAFTLFSPAEELGLELRTPLRTLMQASFHDFHGGQEERRVIRTRHPQIKLRPAEMAMLFTMFAEALGIPCAYVFLQTPTAPGYRILVLCKTRGGAEMSAVFDPHNRRTPIVIPPALGGGTRALENVLGSFTDAVTVILDDEFAAPIGRAVVETRCLGTQDQMALNRMVHGRVPVAVQKVIDEGLYSVPEWNPQLVARAYRQRALLPERDRPYPMVDEEWARDLLLAIDEYDPATLIAPFMLEPAERGPRTWVVENKGPTTTAGILAGMARVFSRQYTDIFRRLVQWIWETAADTEWFADLPPATQAYWQGSVSYGPTPRQRRGMSIEEVVLDLPNNGPVHLGYVVGEWIRREMPYCEETIAVEEITGTLAALRMMLFRRRSQFFDCDDVTLAFMTMMESAIGSAYALHDTLVQAVRDGKKIEGEAKLVLAGLQPLFEQLGPNKPVIMTAVRLAGDPPRPGVPSPDKYHVYPLLLIGDATYVVDVSNPFVVSGVQHHELPLSDELVHGGNQETRVPQAPDTWLGMFYADVDVTDGQRVGAGAVGYRAGLHAPNGRW